MTKASQLAPPQRGSTILASRSTSCTLVLARTARCWPAAGTLMLPVPGVTLQFAGVSRMVHGPPVSALPHPPVTVRPKPSDATTETAFAGNWTHTSTASVHSRLAASRKILAMTSP